MLAPLLQYVSRRRHADRLLQNPSFLRYWLSGALNGFATQVSGLAIPLCAALLLRATPAEMGILVAMQFLPFALFGLPAGVWLDRHRKRPILFGCKLMSTLALASVVAVHWCGLLSMAWLYGVAFIIGFGLLVGGSAEQILLRGIVDRDAILSAQARFTSIESITRLLGPGIAGALVQFASAPLTLLVSAAVMIVSITIFRTILFPDPQPPRASSHPIEDMRAGLSFIRHQPVLLPLAWGVGAWNLLFTGYLALNVVFVTRTLGLSVGALGLAETAGGIGILTSALAVGRLTRRYGSGMTCLIGFAATTLAFLMTSVLPAQLGGSKDASMVAYAMVLMVRDCGVMLMMLPYLALRQRITPDYLLGRVIATMRFLVAALAPVGAIAAGFCADRLGIRTTLAVIGGASLLLGLVLYRKTPLARVR